MDMSILLDRISASPNSKGMDLPQGVSKEAAKLNGKSVESFDEKFEKVSSQNKPKSEVSDSSRRELVSEKDVSSNSKTGRSNENEEIKDDQKASVENASGKKGQAVEASNLESDVEVESVSSKEIVDLAQLDDAQLDEKLAAFLAQMGIKPELIDKIVSNDKLKAEFVQNIQSLEKINAIPELKSDIQNVIKQWVAAATPSKDNQLGAVALKQSIKSPEIQKIMQEAGLQLDPEQMPSEKSELLLKPIEQMKSLSQRIESLVKDFVSQKHAVLQSNKNSVDEAQLKSLVKSVSENKAKPMELSLNSEEAVASDMPGDRPARFKDLIDGLFVQKGLSHETTNQQLIQFSKNEFQNVSGEFRTDSKLVRTNLFEDMQTHIAKSLITKEGGEISLRLRPGNLGEVKLNIQVDAKSVRIQMETEKAAASHVLKSQVSELKQQLSAAGLKVDDISISQSKQSAAQDEQRHSNLDQRQEQHGNQHQRQKQESNENSSSLFADYEDEILSRQSVA